MNIEHSVVKGCYPQAEGLPLVICSYYQEEWHSCNVNVRNYLKIFQDLSIWEEW
jgi:hypothetical protein